MKGFTRIRVKTGMLMMLAAAAGLTACGGSGEGEGSEKAPIVSDQETASPKPVTLRFFTNNSDRKVGQGKMEQDLIDRYMEEHPNVSIKVETLSPDPQYQDKIKVYNASNNLPDIISSWGNSSFLKPLVDSGALADLDRSAVSGLGFVGSALDSYSIDGKLYGLPRNSDFWVLYYNKKLFADNGLEAPRTEADLMDLIAKLKAKRIVPIAMDGREAWTSGIWFDTIMHRVAGHWDISRSAMDGTGSFDHPSTVAAAKAIQRWVNAGAFGSGFLNQDYGAARNLFGQGKAAMFMMGEWEMGMASDDNFPVAVRDNIGAIPLPTVDGGRGTTGGLTAWFGGGYSVSDKSEHKAEAIAFLQWMFQPEHWAKGVWQNGITFPAQNYDQFVTGSETALQLDLSEIFNQATSYSGTVAQDKFTADTQKTYYDSLQLLESGTLTPEQFTAAIAAAARTAAEETQP